MTTPAVPLPGTEPAPLVVAHAVSTWLPQTCTWLHTQLRYLPPGIESHVLCESTANLDQFPVPHLHALDRDPPRFLWDRALRRVGARSHMGSLMSLPARLGASLLHSHFGNVGWANARAARRRGLKHVVTFYGYDVNFLPRTDPRWRGRYAELFEQVDLVLAEGPFMAKTIVALGCPPEKMRVHRLGVDLSRIPYRPRVYRPEEPLRVLIGAAFREKKGIPVALDALGKLRGEIPIQVTILGDAPNDERGRIEKRKILDAIERNALTEHVRLLGNQPHARFLEAAYDHHVFLSPSQTAEDGDTEGGAPVSVIEMAASGMPIVSTLHCDIPEVVPPGSCGFLSPERDAGGVAAHLLWLARHPAAWPGFTEAARRRMEAEFNAVIQGERLAEIYREFLP